jgi:uncharacterized phage protein (TIGR02220 family)
VNEKPNYYAIIPAEVRYDNTLRPNEKLLYGEITALSHKTGDCWASNKYFSELYNVKSNAIAVWIRHLKEKGYINIEHKYKGKEIQQRIIKIGGIQKDTTYYSKEYEGGIQKDTDNNTSINNTSINNIYIVEQVIKHLNEITNSNYKSTTRTTRDKIIARLNEGFTLDDFIVVIDKKYWDWKDTKFEQYMRPETLFGTKFESYLNQPVKKKTTKDIKLDDKFYEELMKA